MTERQSLLGRPGRPHSEYTVRPDRPHAARRPSANSAACGPLSRNGEPEPPGGDRRHQRGLDVAPARLLHGARGQPALLVGRAGVQVEEPGPGCQARRRAAACLIGSSPRSRRSRPGAVPRAAVSRIRPWATGRTAAARAAGLPGSAKRDVPGDQVGWLPATRSLRRTTVPTSPRHDERHAGHAGLHTDDGTLRTSPQHEQARGAQQRRPALTVKVPPDASTSRVTVKKPVGARPRCRWGRRLSSLSSAIAWATDPGSMHAVATDTAPSTPIASCTRWG